MSFGKSFMDLMKTRTNEDNESLSFETLLAHNMPQSLNIPKVFKAVADLNAYNVEESTIQAMSAASFATAIKQNPTTFPKTLLDLVAFTKTDTFLPPFVPIPKHALEGVQMFSDQLTNSGSEFYNIIRSETCLPTLQGFGLLNDDAKDDDFGKLARGAWFDALMSLIRYRPLGAERKSEADFYAQVCVGLIVRPLQIFSALSIGMDVRTASDVANRPDIVGAFAPRGQSVRDAGEFVRTEVKMDAQLVQQQLLTHADFKRMVTDLPASLARLSDRLYSLSELKTFGIIIAVDPNEPLTIRLAFLRCVAVPPDGDVVPSAADVPAAAPAVAFPEAESDSGEHDHSSDDDYEPQHVGTKRGLSSGPPVPSKYVTSTQKKPLVVGYHMTLLWDTTLSLGRRSPKNPGFTWLNTVENLGRILGMLAYIARESTPAVISMDHISNYLSFPTVILAQPITATTSLPGGVATNDPSWSRILKNLKSSVPRSVKIGTILDQHTTSLALNGTRATVPCVVLLKARSEGAVVEHRIMNLARTSNVKHFLTQARELGVAAEGYWQVMPRLVMLDKLAGNEVAVKLFLRQLPELLQELLALRILCVDVKPNNFGFLPATPIDGYDSVKPDAVLVACDFDAMIIYNDPSSITGPFRCAADLFAPEMQVQDAVVSTKADVYTFGRMINAIVPWDAQWMATIRPALQQLVTECSETNVETRLTMESMIHALIQLPL